MRRIFLILAALALSACSVVGGFTHVDYSSHEIDHRAKERPTLAFLGQNYQICMPWKEQTVPVDIFVVPKHPGKVTFVIQDQIRVELVGDSVHLHLGKVGFGAFKADIYLDDEYQLTVSWSVWNCGPKNDMDRNLYRPTAPGNPGGLKGYCPECECTTPE